MVPTALTGARGWSKPIHTFPGFDYVAPLERVLGDQFQDHPVDDTVPVKSYGDVAREYGAHPESKFHAPDGTPCARRTTGTLKRRLISSSSAEYVGKEGNHVGRRHEGVGVADEVQHVYESPDAVRAALAVLEPMPRKEVATALGVSERSLRAWIYGRAQPRPGTPCRLIQLATRLTDQRR